MSSLVLMGARPYDPNLGRFLAVDPVDGGSLNNYDYAGQDPINGYDLGGTMSEEEEAAGDSQAIAARTVEEEMDGELTCKPTDWIKFAGRQLQHMIGRGHGADFGIEGEWNPEAGQALKDALGKFVDGENTKLVQGTFRGQQAMFYVNTETRQAVIVRPDGELWSGWRLGAKAFSHLMNGGTLGGG